MSASRSPSYPPVVRLLAALFACALSAAGQSTTGTITGLVVDSTAASVLGATVQVRNLATNAPVGTVTTDLGSYTLPSLAPGRYEITVSMAGFKNARASGVVVNTAQITTQNFTLEVGQLSESVLVTSEAPLINPNSAAVTTTIQNKMLQDLPFMDRSILSVALLTPGSQGDPQYNSGVQSELPGIWTQPVTPGVSISVGGGRPGSGSILVDGSDVTSAGFAKAVMTFSNDTVEEVSVQANGIPAQYGRTTTAIINQATKSGSNQFHGNASWSHLDPFLQTQALGATFPPTGRYNQFAAAIGGPVIIPKLYDGRNRTFFWASGEPQRLKLLYGASPTRLPTKDELAGNFRNSWDFLDPTLRKTNVDAAIASPIRTNDLRFHHNRNADGFPIGEELPVAQRPVIANNDLSYLLAKNPLAQRIIKTIYPFTPGVDTPYVKWLRPDGLWDVNGNNASFARGAESVDNRWSFKIDQLLGPSNRLAFRYSSAPVRGTRFDWGGSSDPSGPIAQDETVSKNAALSYNHIFSGNMVNELRLTYSRSNSLRGPNAASMSKDWGAALGLLPAVAGQGFPSILGRGYNADGQNNGRSVDVNLGIGNDFSWIRGRHSLKFGGDHRRIQLNRLTYGGLTGGSYSFSGQITPNSGGIWGTMDQLGGLITGALNNYSYKKAQTNAYYRWRYVALYIQDDFRVTSKLTLNLGLRYDIETPRTEKYDRQGSFDPFIEGTVNGKPVRGAFVFAGRNGRVRNLWPINYTGFQPRIGIVYALRNWMTWRASYNLLRAPITGVGLDISPDLNLTSTTISSGARVGGVSPGPINLITNPIGPLGVAQELGRDPIFFMNNTNSFGFSCIPQNSNMPYAQKWNLGTQLLLTKDLSVEIGYEGAKGTHLFATSLPINAVDWQVAARLVTQGADFTSRKNEYNLLGITNSDGSIIQGRLLDSLRPYPQFFNRGISTVYDRSGNSIYHALLVGFHKRFSHGLTFQGSYSWSKSIDDGSSNLQTGQVADVFGIVNAQSWDRRLERGLSVYDMPHKFNVAFTYELPLGSGKLVGGHAGSLLDRVLSGWNISGIFRRQSGYPVTIYNGGNGWFESRGGGSGLDGVTLRPDRIPGVPIINPTWRDDPFTRSYINPEAFAVPGGDGDPRLGNSARTLPDARSPLLTSFDAAVFKNIKFTREGSRYLQLRVDVLNAANHPVFFINPGRGNAGVFSFDAKSRRYTTRNDLSAPDRNNTAQFNNYAGRAFRIGARIYF